ncbi:MAG: hypothetical protein HY275_00715 [Gemmatimonadetes bacterium]|nr:hypothetical protein [Gemmatimonadota bacterium]
MSWIPAELPVGLAHQLGMLVLLALPIACIAWTVTHEDVFREPRAWCARRSVTARSAIARKFFYLFTCEYCFSHYVTAACLVATRFQLLYDGWQGYVLAEFALVWLANALMSVHNRLRLGIKFDHATIAVEQEKLAAPPAGADDL